MNLVTKTPVLVQTKVTRTIRLPSTQGQLALIISAIIESRGNGRGAQAEDERAVFAPRDRVISTSTVTNSIVAVRERSSRALPLLTGVRLAITCFGSGARVRVHSKGCSVIRASPLIVCTGT